jgi:hypothetical protein
MTILDRVDVDSVSREAREVSFTHVVLTIFTAVFFFMGWTVAKTWLSFSWAGVAIRAGWREGRAAGVNRGPGRPR